MPTRRAETLLLHHAARRRLCTLAGWRRCNRRSMSGRADHRHVIPTTPVSRTARDRQSLCDAATPLRCPDNASTQTSQIPLMETIASLHPASHPVLMMRCQPALRLVGQPATARLQHPWLRPPVQQQQPPFPSPRTLAHPSRRLVGRAAPCQRPARPEATSAALAVAAALAAEEPSAYLSGAAEAVEPRPLLSDVARASTASPSMRTPAHRPVPAAHRSLDQRPRRSDKVTIAPRPPTPEASASPRTANLSRTAHPLPHRLGLVRTAALRSPWPSTAASRLHTRL